MEARHLARSGDVEAALQRCESVSRAAVVAGDAELAAEAALTVEPVPQVGLWSLRARQRALAERALRLVEHDRAHDGPTERDGAADTDLATRLRAVIGTAANPWSGDGASLVRRDGESSDPSVAAAKLRARHGELVHPRHVDARLELAAEMIALGTSIGDDELHATGRAWRLDALGELGRRRELDAELLDLSGLVDRIDSGWWRWWRLSTWSALADLDGSHEEALERADRAAAFGAERGVPEAPFVHLIAQTRIALRTGARLAAVEEGVRGVLRHAPLEARGWHAQLLVARGMIDEARSIWRLLATRLDAVPDAAPEWTVAHVGSASLAVAFEDRDAAAIIHRLLAPYEGLHVAGSVHLPSSGPIALHLARLAALTGDSTMAQRHLDTAEADAVAAHAPEFLADAQRERESLAAKRSVLTARERDVARAVGLGETNAQIARRLFVSERTVESHVSAILRKLSVSSRAAVAAWVTRQSNEL